MAAAQSRADVTEQSRSLSMLAARGRGLAPFHEAGGRAAKGPRNHRPPPQPQPPADCLRSLHGRYGKRARRLRRAPARAAPAPGCRRRCRQAP
eukprot:scaffold114589_cov38-Phaeocystis_antarctica.AAC.2